MGDYKNTEEKKKKKNFLGSETILGKAGKSILPPTHFPYRLVKCKDKKGKLSNLFM